jgi:hypothetical protein
MLVIDIMEVPNGNATVWYYLERSEYRRGNCRTLRGCYNAFKSLNWLDSEYEITISRVTNDNLVVRNESDWVIAILSS